VLLVAFEELGWWIYDTVRVFYASVRSRLKEIYWWRCTRAWDNGSTFWVRYILTNRHNRQKHDCKYK